ncbi:hypothetical protein ACSBR2_015051 [Camellia fascicularis]
MTDVTGIIDSSFPEILPLSNTPSGPWKCDISNSDDTQTKLLTLNDVTYLFYVTWTNRFSKNYKANGSIDLKRLKSLTHLSSNGSKYYISPFNLVRGKSQSNDPSFIEDLPRLASLNFYYTIKDILFKESVNKEELT